MQAHILRKVVRIGEHIGLTFPHLEFVQQHIQDLCYMEMIMWETTHDIQPHLEYLLQFNNDGHPCQYFINKLAM